MYNTSILDEKHKDISIIASITYCLLIGISIIPIYRFNTAAINNIKIPSIKLINILTYIYVCNVIFNLLVYWKDILFILNYGDWAALRLMITNGETLTTVRLSGIMKIISLFFNVTGSISFIMFPISFISLCFLKKPLWYSLMALFSTTNVILNGILGCDRSSTFQWFLLFVLNLIIFWKYIEFKKKLYITPIIVSLTIGAFLYMASITIGRFEDTNRGTKGGLIDYAGQSYINFCYLFDNYDNKEGFNTHYFFPAIHKWIIKDYENNVGLQQEMTKKSGIECGIFYTFLGSFLIDCNQSGPFVFIIVYLVLFALVKRKDKNNNITFEGFMQNYLLMIIPTFGIIAYPFTSGYSTLSILILLSILRIFTKKHHNESINSR